MEINSNKINIKEKDNMFNQMMKFNMNNNPYNQNENVNNPYNPNNNMNNNPNLQQQKIGNEFITQNQFYQNQKDKIDLESLSNFPDLSSTYSNSQTLNSNNDTLNEGFGNNNYIKHYDVIEEPEEIFYMNDSIITEKKKNVSNKIKISIDEIKKNNIPLAMQNIANCIGILKNFPKDANSNFK